MPEKLSQTFYDELVKREKRFSEAQPELELTVRDNDLGVEGYVVVWNSAPGARGPLGPCGKGGTRITPTVSLDEIKMLAKIMSLKNAAAGLAMGGAKSGIKADPDEPGFEAKYRRFVELIRPVLRENGGIFGGLGFDIGARPIHPHWACDQLKSFRSFTGKPVEMGGTDYDREGIAGLGVAVAAKTLIERSGGDLGKASAAIQGLGAMGGAVFRYLTEFGVPVRYIADPRIGGGYELGRGVTADLIAAFISHDIAAIGEVVKRESTAHFETDEVLFQQADLLLPCALQGVITVENSSRIKAKFIVEGANNPTSAEAQKILSERGMKIIPDFIANPGGIIAAFVELTSTISAEENARTRKNVEDAKEYTRVRIADNVSAVLALADQYGVECVSAARLLALRNMQDAVL